MQGPGDQGAGEWEAEEWEATPLVSIASCLCWGMLACGHLHNPAQLCCAWRGALANAIRALQAAAAALPELAMAQAAEDWEAELLVSSPSCLRCGMLACGRLRTPAVC